ncbi:hypothetical protein Y1Q_0014162 [Alligator mississippiensis]|uniref:Uncharacterized protein n=1 Tax=Alligator mississippiensis TaxID=8496 RepID=A0A151MU03_ALLMI|nr:hypothetical protein Y1Q_0014162 [Alligator mississippiensis]
MGKLRKPTGANWTVLDHTKTPRPCKFYQQPLKSHRGIPKSGNSKGKSWAAKGLKRRAVHSGALGTWEEEAATQARQLVQLNNPTASHFELYSTHPRLAVLSQYLLRVEELISSKNRRQELSGSRPHLKRELSCYPWDMYGAVGWGRASESLFS